MNQSWQKFLVSQRAHIADDQVADFGDPGAEIDAAANGTIIADLSHIARIYAYGADAESFLHGQLSNDLQGLDASTSQLSAYCNPKGRMLAVFRVIRFKDGFLLQFPAVSADAVVPRLRMYVLRADVHLERVDDEYIAVGLSGPDAAAGLVELGYKVPPAPNAVTRHDGAVVCALPGSQPRFEVILPAVQAVDFWNAAATNKRPAGAACWRALDISAGIPTIYPATSEQFVPQMANLDLIDGINFKKGCYPGQEIVARMHYLGKLKDRMMIAHANGNRLPLPGDPLYAADYGDQAAGHVVDATAAAGGGYDLLAIAKLSAMDAGEFHLAAPDGELLQRRELPYSLDRAS